MKADLHMHSTYSDGRYQPKQLVEAAVEKQLDIIALTDHDTVGAVEAMITYGESKGVRVIPGIELSTLEQNKSVHLLGYFRDESYRNEEIVQYTKEIKTKREERAKKMIQNLKNIHDIDISYDRVYALSNGIIARPHIAKAIIEAYPEYRHDEVFERFIGEHNPAYVPSVELPVEEGIKLLKRHNCVVVLAHPTLLKPQIKDTVLAYDFDGIEARYYQNKPGDEKSFRVLAAKRNMVITGGSDFHGIENDSKHGEIGEVVIDGLDVDAFLDLLENNAKTSTK